MPEKRSRFIVSALKALLAKAITVPKGSIAPAVQQLLEQTYPAQRFTINAVGQALRRLEQRGLVQRHYRNQTITFELTQQGKEAIAVPMVSNVVPLERPAQWDQQWRIVLFSIPESKRVQRTIFRQALETLGFVQLQRSAWIYPFPSETIVLDIAQQLGIQDNVHIVTATVLQPDTTFRSVFQLNDTMPTPPSPTIKPVSVEEPDDLLPLTELE